jgi:hypothetical protein
MMPHESNLSYYLTTWVCSARDTLDAVVGSLLASTRASAVHMLHSDLGVEGCAVELARHRSARENGEGVCVLVATDVCLPALDQVQSQYHNSWNPRSLPA